MTVPSVSSPASRSPSLATPLARDGLPSSPSAASPLSAVPADLLDLFDLFFGKTRRRMATNPQAEVWRLPDEHNPADAVFRKRFLVSDALGDFTYWTGRENLLLHALNNTHPKLAHVQQFLMLRQGDTGNGQHQSVLETRHAGPDVGMWLQLPVQRQGQILPHVLADCAHWLALARATLMTLLEVHKRGFVHLDVKVENFCIPYTPNDYQPDLAQDAAALAVALSPDFSRIRLIDMAFSLWEGKVALDDMPLPVNPDADPQQFRYLSQQFRHALREGLKGNLAPTRRLDFRADLYSLGVMLSALLPQQAEAERGWRAERLKAAKALCRQLEAYDEDWQRHGDKVPSLPHAALLERCETLLQESDLQASLAQGWGLVWQSPTPRHAPTPVTPVTPPTPVSPQVPPWQPDAVPPVGPSQHAVHDSPMPQVEVASSRWRQSLPGLAAALLGAGCVAGGVFWYMGANPASPLKENVHASRHDQDKGKDRPVVRPPRPVPPAPPVTDTRPPLDTGNISQQADALLAELLAASPPQQVSLLHARFPTGQVARTDPARAVLDAAVTQAEREWSSTAYDNPDRVRHLRVLLNLQTHLPDDGKAPLSRQLAETYQRDSRDIENSDWWQKNAAPDAASRSWSSETALLATRGIKLALFNQGLALTSGKGVQRDTAQGGKLIASALRRVTLSSLTGSDAGLVRVGLDMATRQALLGNDPVFARNLLPGLRHLSDLDDITASYLTAEIAACRLQPPDMALATQAMQKLTELPPQRKGATAWIETARQRLQAFRHSPVSCRFEAGPEGERRR